MCIFSPRVKLRKACTLFPSQDEALEYMASYGLETPRATLLEQLGRYSEAAECQLAEGNISEATRLFLLDTYSPAALSRAARTVLDGLWSALSFTGSLAQSPIGQARDRGSLDDLLRLLDMFRDLPMDADDRDEVRGLNALRRACDHNNNVDGRIPSNITGRPECRSPPSPQLRSIQQRGSTVPLP